MGNYRHSTDRVDGTIIARCSTCDEYEASTEYTAAANKKALSKLKEILGGECPHCGSEVTVIVSEQPTEVIE
jgi:DNA-directed RNA polymerase subunit RPC12/RpoP